MKAESIRRLSVVEKPDVTKYLGERAPKDIQAWGNVEFLYNRKIAFFCSQRCPGSVLAKMYDLAQILSQRPVTLLGGFQSPVEQEFLNRLLRSAMSAIVCPARALTGVRLKPEWREPMVQGRLLLLSPFGDGIRRTNRTLALQRNRFVAAVADEILLAFASPGGANMKLFSEMQRWKKRIYTLNDPVNQPLIVKGAQPLLPQEAFSCF
ncbi:hypothetical protein GX408_14840 [bacterium]|nr:hypothetical protein [bacterium]